MLVHCKKHLFFCKSARTVQCPPINKQNWIAFDKSSTKLVQVCI